ncbi:MAG: TatD family hydrolase [Clostridiales bacterium]|nr:TatD family hydrolase [Clostridiales bacterium]
MIDTHTHLTDDRYEKDLDEIITTLSDNGIRLAITVGYDVLSSIKGLELSKKYDNIYCAVGVHPHDAKNVKSGDYDKFIKAAEFDKVVAIGEIGLDYYYNLSPEDTQKRVFLEQLELADHLKLPVVLHVRDAYLDTMNILKQNKHLLKNGFLLHCYSGSKEFAMEMLKLGAYFAFGGAITFKNAVKPVEALQTIPSDRFMFETDCPYMSPVPFRGKRNEPKYIKYVLEKAAEARGEDIRTVETESDRNALSFFWRIK